MKTVDRNVITGLRFAEDVKYYNILKKNKKVTNMAKDVIGEFTDIRSESNFMKTGLKVTNEIAPRYFNLFKQAQDCMGFSEDQIIPYIQQDSSVNAACIHENDDKYLIYLRSLKYRYFIDVLILPAIRWIGTAPAQDIKQ